jgi:hypothetical protein
MAIYTGDTGTVKVGETTIGSIKSWSYEVSAAAIDTTVMGGDGWANFVPGQKAWTGTAELIVYKDAVSDATPNNQSTFSVGDTLSDVTFLFDETSATEASKGNGFIETVGVSSSTGEMVTMSVSIKGKGALTSWQD